MGAAAGVWYGWVTVETITAPTCDASSPARSSAWRARRSAMSTTDSSGAARKREMMPERSWIHWSEESIGPMISSFITTRSGR